MASDARPAEGMIEDSAGGFAGRRWLPAVAAVGAFALVLAVLHHVLAEYRPDDVLRALEAIPRAALATAGALTAASYALLTGYDALALRYAGRRLPYPRVALTSFVAYAFGPNLSLASLTGAAVRYRIYSAAGLSALDVATVVSFCALTSALGLGLLGGGALLLAAPGTTALHLGHAWSQAFGVLLLGLVAAYLGWACAARRPFTVGAWALRPPGAGIALPQALVAAADLSVASGVLWALLPDAAGLDFPTFAGLYAIALVAGVISQVPGGLGVFETILLLALPRVPAPDLLGALLAYRAIYYLAPLCLATGALVAHEVAARRERVAGAGRSAGTWASHWLRPVAPQLVAALVFVAGAVLLVSGATPELDERMRALRAIVPLPLLELSHLAGSVAGVGLLVLARGLHRRANAAYHVTAWLLACGIVACLLKGLDFEEASFLAVVLLVLRLARDAFHRPASLFGDRFTPGWLAGVGIILVLSVWVGFLAYRHVPYANDLWWTFAVHGDAPRMLRASLAATVLIAALVALQSLRPAAPAADADAPPPPERLAPALAHADGSLANAVYAGDKRVLMHPSGAAFLMYQVAGRSWIALGDPVGEPSHHEELVWRHRERVDRHGGRIVFYQVSPARLPLYLDLGLSLFKLGEEARVPLEGFSLDGPARADLRQMRRRAQRDGATFEVVTGDALEPLLPRLRAVSDEWLRDKAAAEKGFSLGAFREDYVRRFPVAIVRAEGTVVAFANLWPTATREELSVDLMRFGLDAPRGAMDYLLTETMLWGRAEGYRWFNLGMAPLSGLETRALAPAWHRLGAFVQRHGEAFYNFEGLRRYKNKFDPVWAPRYLAARPGLDLPHAVYDVTTLISGGLRELLTK